MFPLCSNTPQQSEGQWVYSDPNPSQSPHTQELDCRFQQASTPGRREEWEAELTATLRKTRSLEAPFNISKIN